MRCEARENFRWVALEGFLEELAFKLCQCAKVLARALYAEGRANAKAQTNVKC